MRADLDALDLARRNLHPLRARLIRVHGLHGGIIPYTESMALARAVRPGQAQLFLVEGLAHVDIRRLGFFDRWRLLCASEAIAERKAGPP